MTSSSVTSARPHGQLPLYDGNDVLLGGVGTVTKGFGGDDIMLGVGVL